MAEFGRGVFVRIRRIKRRGFVFVEDGWVNKEEGILKIVICGSYAAFFFFSRELKEISIPRA